MKNNTSNSVTAGPGQSSPAHHGNRLNGLKENYFDPKPMSKKKIIFSKISRCLKVPYDCGKKPSAASLLRVTRKGGVTI